MLEEKILSQKETFSRQSARWDAHNIFKNYFTLVSTQIGGALFSFATVLVATRLYGADGYGNIVAIAAGSQAIQLLTNWTNIALSRYGVEEFVETEKITKAFWSRSAIFVPNIVTIASTAPLWIYWLLALLHLPSAASPLIILHFIFSVIWLHFQQALQALKLPRFQGFLILLERVIVFALVVFFGQVLRLSWLYAFYAFIVAAFLMSIVALWRIRHNISWSISIDRQWVRKLLAFSIPLFPYSITSFFCTNYLDTFFITKYLSKSELGIYSVGYQINGLLLQFLILIGTLLMPMFVTLRSKNLEKYITNYLEDFLPLLTLIWGLIIPFVAILFGYLIPLAFGSKFSHLSGIIWVFMMGTSLMLPSVIGYSPFATAASAVYISFPLAVITAITNIIGDIILIPKWGLIGSAWATSLSSITAMISIILLISWKFKLKIGLLLQSTVPVLLGLASYFITKDILTSSIISSVLTLILLLAYYRRFVVTGTLIYNIKTLLKR